MNKIPVSVLGATGVVGQRFIRRLARHPYFELQVLAASERNAGKTYAEACEWRLSGLPYAGFADRILSACIPGPSPTPVVFSALDATAARDIEPLFAAAGSLVFSNASAFRMEEDVPLIIPEINPDHLALLSRQRINRGWTGGIVCNPNCTTTVALGAIGPLHRAFGAEGILLTSMQALSGAGYPGVSAMDSTGNVIPYIPGEETKVEAETRKILGRLSGDTILAAEFPVSAQCNRVPVLDGHTLCLNLRLSGHPEASDIVRALEQFVPHTEGMNLPSAPKHFIRLREEQDRPQPRRDVDDDRGMTMHVGRIRNCPVLGTKLVVLGHNVERGAAGGSLLNAELALASGYLSGYTLGSLQPSFIEDGWLSGGSRSLKELQYTNLLPSRDSQGSEQDSGERLREQECELWT